MSGPTLTMTAPAVDTSTPLPFHRSHSSPHVLPASPTTGTAITKHQTPLELRGPDATSRPPAANINKELPSLPFSDPEFEIPSFDFDFSPEFKRSFSFCSDKLESPTVTVVTAPETRLLPIASTEAPAEPTKPIPPRTSPKNIDSYHRNSTNTAPTVAAVPRAEGHGRSRSKSMIDRPLSWLPSSKSSPNVPTSQELCPQVTKSHVSVSTGDLGPHSQLERPRTVESFADFAKKSWISKSQSPSPPTTPERLRHESREPSTERKKSPVKSRLTLRTRARSDDDSSREAAAEPQGSSSTSRVLSRASVYLTRIKQRPQSVFSRTSSPLSLSASSSIKSSKSSDSESASPATAAPSVKPGPAKSSLAPSSLPRSAVIANNNAFAHVESAPSRSSSHRTSSLESDLDTETTATTSASSEIASQGTADTNITMPHPTSRDPLWGTFRTLDGEFARFAARPTTSTRMDVVRGVLMPFLKSTSHHPSNSSRSVLSSEDFDRRGTILNKWWNGLLSMLDAGHSRLLAGGYGLAPGIAALGVQFPVLQPVAGVDRPTLLEAATMIMMRPEWRTCTSQFQPLAERSPEEKVRARSNTTSTVGSDVDSLLTESAEHNVRTMFVNNLTTQMALVVEKMSLRHAPLSLVNWCGKACAYAFFFVPGIADVLVRLWGLNADILRRVADEFGLPRRSKGESEDIVALYPEHLHKLGWSSVKTLGDKLRLAAKLPLMPAKIPWHGPWVSRWRGGETDLFFIFCKYFHILSEQFIFEGLPQVEKARSPAFVLVHAQVLSVLDSTIHRQASLDAMLGPPISDSIHGADATLTSIPVPSNVLKGMDENRLIVLLKDVLSESAVGVNHEIKHTFAEAFAAISKAAAKRTPRFDQASCFMLCDFLEEMLVTLDTFQNTVNGSPAGSPAEEIGQPRYLEFGSTALFVNYIDWPFWLEVGKMMAESNNTMSEIRVLSFLYSVWDAIASDPVRKETLCMEWLLTEEFFSKFFNHWCPMVRAYYMRLLCWRICRDSGSASEVNSKIFLTVSERLKTLWAHYLWLKADADMRGKVQPSTAPAHPTPGKRFLIIRTEVQPPQPNIKLGFDSFSSSFPGSDQLVDYAGTFGINGGDSVGGAKDDGDVSSFKKRLSILGKVLPFNSQNGRAADPKRTWDEELEQARRETAAARTGPRQGPPPPPKRPGHHPTLSTDSISTTGSAPIYEATTYVFRFALTWQTGPGGQPMPLGPTRDRILTRPRLPAPAQARVSARSAALNDVGNFQNGSLVYRSDSPPPIAPGLPPDTRRVSGALQTGLISEARNARPLSVVDDTPRKSMESSKRRYSFSIDVTAVASDSEDERYNRPSPLRHMSFDGHESARPSFDMARIARPPAPAIRAEKPTGVYASGAVYTGRALAEWAIIINECNSFVDRRRDEGVLGLAEVEIPILGVDGLGMRQQRA
ncbi:hypothetical protein QBC40DRAFT_249367 [Triangularia verruculosa]|uniref:DUF1765-domain-containing protein n=1 Tax=Triangularia verruculosa TaxID=2587418 RepID=A0AAN6XX86_9PEZI|nr:hypothetical protein QBC40DRAFT_249367 [Triangularia verruculosa]